MNQLSAYDDNTLVTLLKKGDRAVFTEIYNRYWDKLYFLAYSHLKSEPATEGIVQEVFLTLWKQRDRLDITILPAYLAAMTRHAVYRKLAREKRKKEMEAKLVAGHQAEMNEIELIDSRNLLRMVEKLSANLPEKCRLVFIHNKLLDKSIGEVAKSLNISAKTAEAHLTKALKIVRSRMDQTPDRK